MDIEVDKGEKALERDGAGLEQDPVARDLARKVVKQIARDARQADLDQVAERIGAQQLGESLRP